MKWSEKRETIAHGLLFGLFVAVLSLGFFQPMPTQAQGVPMPRTAPQANQDPVTDPRLEALRGRAATLAEQLRTACKPECTDKEVIWFAIIHQAGHSEAGVQINPERCHTFDAWGLRKTFYAGVYLKGAENFLACKPLRFIMEEDSPIGSYGFRRSETDTLLYLPRPTSALELPQIGNQVHTGFIMPSAEPKIKQSPWSLTQFEGRMRIDAELPKGYTFVYAGAYGYPGYNHTLSQGIEAVHSMDDVELLDGGVVSIVSDEDADREFCYLFAQMRQHERLASMYGPNGLLPSCLTVSLPSDS